jgi:iron(III) transport system substrate-binding protein
MTRPGMSLAILAATAALLAGCAEHENGGDDIVVYSARQAHLIQPLFDRYTEATGTPVRFVTDNAGALLQRLRSEDGNTPADLLLTVDAGNLWRAAESGMLRPVDSGALREHIPARLRDPQDRWFGLSVRARTIVHSTERVTPAELSTYAALADEKWRNRLCLRTSKKVYNQSLVAMLIAQRGEARAEEIVRGWVANLAAPPFANDTAVLEAIAAGQCDVGIVNSYYFGRLEQDSPGLPLALFWANQDAGGDARGVHVNVSGGGVVRHAGNPEGATDLLEWLSTDEAQRLFASLNLEFPANPGVAPAEQVAAWGGFEANPLNISRAGELQTAAVALMDRAGYR